MIKHEAYNATDLRGHVAIEKPTAGYDKRKIADDIRALTDRFATLDNVPRRIVFQRMNAFSSRLSRFTRW